MRRRGGGSALCPSGYTRVTQQALQPREGGGGAGRVADSLLPHRLCSSPPFALDALGGSPAEVRLAFPIPPTSIPEPSRASPSRVGWPCPLADRACMATEDWALATGRLSLLSAFRLAAPKGRAAFLLPLALSP